MPLEEQILSLLGSLYIDLGYSDAFTPTVPRFVKIMAFVGKESITTS